MPPAGPAGQRTRAKPAKARVQQAQPPRARPVRNRDPPAPGRRRPAAAVPEGANISESVLLQRCARLLSGSLATWAIVDVQRRGQLRRHYVAGPDDPESSGLAHAVATADPGPGTVPDQVHESGKTLLLTHVADEMALGPSPDGPPFLTMLGATSLLCVPVTDGSRKYGVVTLLRHSAEGQFGLADAGLAEDVSALLGLAISGRRVLRQRTETADALRASLLPPVLKPIPGVEIGAAHLAPTARPGGRRRLLRRLSDARRLGCRHR